MQAPTLPELSSAKLIGYLRQRVALALYLASMEFSRRFSSTAGGAAWMFISPLLTIFTIWLALDLGLSARGHFGSEFGLVFAVGLSVWLFFSDVVNSATSSIISSPHLVKKVVFPVAVLPVSVTLAAFFVHLCVFGCVALVIVATGAQMSWSLLLLPFWMACLLFYSASLGLFLASINVRYRDTSVIAPNVVALLFWLTPLVWLLKQVAEPWKTIVLLNPMAVIIQGYRGAMNLGPSELTPGILAIFAIQMIATAIFAARVYKRYRREFSDRL